MYRILKKKNGNFHLEGFYGDLPSVIIEMYHQKAAGYVKITLKDYANGENSDLLAIANIKEVCLLSSYKAKEEDVKKSEFFIKNKITNISYFDEKYSFVRLGYSNISIDTICYPPKILKDKIDEIVKILKDRKDKKRDGICGIALIIQNVVVKVAISHEYILSEEQCEEKKLPYHEAFKVAGNMVINKELMTHGSGNGEKENLLVKSLNSNNGLIVSSKIVSCILSQEFVDSIEERYKEKAS